MRLVDPWNLIVLLISLSRYRWCRLYTWPTVIEASFRPAVCPSYVPASSNDNSVRRWAFQPFLRLPQNSGTDRPGERTQRCFLRRNFALSDNRFDPSTLRAQVLRRLVASVVPRKMLNVRHRNEYKLISLQILSPLL